MNDLHPLVQAAVRGDLDAAQALMSRDSPPEVAGQALVGAAEEGRTEVVSYLLSHGVNANTRGWGRVPLHGAAGAGRLAVVSLLLDAGADATARDERGASALHWAVEGAMPWYDEPTDVPTAMAIVQVLLRHGADATVRDEGGRTALDVAEKVHGTRFGPLRQLLRHAMTSSDGAPTEPGTRRCGT